MSTIPGFAPIGSSGMAGNGLADNADLDPRLVRTHYFDGRLLKAEDLIRDQLYLDQRLRELGKVSGSGVARGLEATLDPDTGAVTVRSGVGITGAGRVLELRNDLVVDLGNRAAIAEENDGQFLHFDRGLYALVLTYAEAQQGVAEVFPRDLGAERAAKHSIVAEGVQLALVPLPLQLPQAHPITIRANLIRQLTVGGQAAGTVPEDGVALGVLAIRDDQPRWLDPELLRAPVRSIHQPGDLQADLTRQYEALLADLLAYRRAGSQDGNFAAAEYFPLLPPVGSIPKAALDPARGRQGFFPEHFNVWVAPIRQADLELVKRESMPLPAIDLSSEEPVDVVVLAPLSNLEFGRYARALESIPDPSNVPQQRMPHLDLLRLRLYPIRPVHNLNLDVAAWQAIWSRVADDTPVYVRRPTRAAETSVSGILIARGTTPPDEASAATGDEFGTSDADVSNPADAGDAILDENAVILNRLSMRRLGEMRTPVGTAASNAFERMVADFGTDGGVVLGSAEMLVLVERNHDDLIWQTLFELAGRHLLRELQSLLRGLQTDMSTAQAMAEAGAQIGLPAEMVEGWRDADGAG